MVVTMTRLFVADNKNGVDDEELSGGDSEGGEGLFVNDCEKDEDTVGADEDRDGTGSGADVDAKIDVDAEVDVDAAGAEVDANDVDGTSDAFLVVDLMGTSVVNAIGRQQSLLSAFPPFCVPVTAPRRLSHTCICH